MQVRLNGYSNPTGRCGYGNPCHSPSGQLYCCDSFDTGSCSGWRQCDSYFTYCLRSFGESQLNTSRCSSAQITSSTNEHDRSRDFSWSKVLGLDNPLRLSAGQGAYDVSHFHNVCTLQCHGSSH